MSFRVLSSKGHATLPRDRFTMSCDVVEDFIAIILVVQSIVADGHASRVAHRSNGGIPNRKPHFGSHLF